MDPTSIFSLITGPTGTLVTLSLILYGVVQRRWLVPGWTLAREQDKRELLEKENSALNSSVMTLASQNARLEAQMESLKGEVDRLYTELSHLRSEVGL